MLAFVLFQFRHMYGRHEIVMVKYAAPARDSVLNPFTAKTISL